MYMHNDDTNDTKENRIYPYGVIHYDCYVENMQTIEQ